MLRPLSGTLFVYFSNVVQNFTTYLRLRVLSNILSYFFVLAVHPRIKHMLKWHWKNIEEVFTERIIYTTEPLFTQTTLSFNTVGMPVETGLTECILVRIIPHQIQFCWLLPLATSSYDCFRGSIFTELYGCILLLFVTS